MEKEIVIYQFPTYIRVEERNGSAKVDVNKHYVTGDWEVNWSGRGGVTPTEAYNYGELIKVASAIASDMNVKGDFNTPKNCTIFV